jgi:hypothetical protein
VLWLVLESGSSLVEMIYLGLEAVLFLLDKNPIHQNFGNPTVLIYLFLFCLKVVLLNV